MESQLQVDWFGFSCSPPMGSTLRLEWVRQGAFDVWRSENADEVGPRSDAAAPSHSW